MRRGTTTMRALSAVLAVVGAGLAGALGGCTGGDPAPPPTATSTAVDALPTPTPTPTPSPTPTDPAAIPPERPDAMETVDTAGAEAFATYFMELFPYVFATGDLEAYRAYSHPDCVFCADVASSADEQSNAGGHSTGGQVEVTDVTALEVDPGAWWAVSMDLIQQPSVDLDVNGAVISEVPEKAFHLDMAVVRENGRWLMRGVEYTRTDA